MKKKSKGPIIKLKKLGNQKAWGTAWTEGRYSYIELDPRLGAKPEFSEKKIDRLGKDICQTLWKLGFRRVLADPHSTPTRISK